MSDEHHLHFAFAYTYVFNLRKRFSKSHQTSLLKAHKTTQSFISFNGFQIVFFTGSKVISVLHTQIYAFPALPISLRFKVAFKTAGI